MIFLKKYILLVFLLTISFLGFSQQDPLYTQYLNDPILINPAYAGSRGNVSMNGVFRKQWVGIDWAPTTTSISVNSPFLKYKIGAGFTIINDQIGPMQQTGVYFDYAYHLRFDKNRSLSLGLKAGFNNFDLNLLDLTTTETDEYVQQNDRPNIFLPNFGVGAYYYTENYYVGFSVPKLIRNSLQEKDNTLEIVGREDRTWFVSAGFVYSVIEPIFKVKPTILMRAVRGAPLSVDISATAIFYDRFWIGAMYRIGDAIAVHARVQANSRLQIGYSFDFANSRLASYGNGTHEVFLNYVFSFRGQRVLSPRYF
jgi:type IX secretion system PorP/SprF family membrane protein